MIHDVPRGEVLILSDSSAAGERMRRWAEAAGEAPTLRLVDADHDALAGLDAERCDLVVTDLDPDEPATVSLLRRLLDDGCLPGVPQLHAMRDPFALRRLREVDGRSAALTMPADPDEELFRTRVTLAAEIGRLRRAMSQATIRDPLTGTFNRRFLSLRLDQEFARARRYGTPLSLVLFCMDQLREINEGFGQRAGDAALTRLSELLREQVRREDTFGRWGAKVYAVLLPGTAHRGAATFANHVRRALESMRIATPDGTLPLRVSIGVSSFGDAETTHSAADLVRAAERALLEARRRGGNRVHIDETTVERAATSVLVLDRDTAWLEVVEDLLSVEDVRVSRAPTIAAALAAVRHARPDLVIFDSGLLGDDPSLVEALRAAAPEVHLPVIGIGAGTGGRPPIGVDRFLTRPFSASVLPGIIREVVARSRAAGARLHPV